MSDHPTLQSPSVPIPSSFKPFSRLPQELRVLVYQHLWSDYSCSLERAERKSESEWGPTAILSTNHVIYQEAKAVFYGHVTFSGGFILITLLYPRRDMQGSTARVRAWLEHLDTAAVQRIVVDHDLARIMLRRVADNKAGTPQARLLALFSSLRVVTIDFLFGVCAPEQWPVPPRSGDGQEPLPADLRHLGRRIPVIEKELARSAWIMQEAFDWVEGDDGVSLRVQVRVACSMCKVIITKDGFTVFEDQ